MDGTAAERLARSLADFHVDPELAKTEADRQGMFQARHADSMFRIDIHVVRDTGFHQSELRRATRVQLASEDPGLTALIATAEDTVLSKLVWFENSDRASTRQWSDVLGVIRVQGDRLDWSYMRNWAASSESLRVLEQLD